MVSARGPLKSFFKDSGFELLAYVLGLVSRVRGFEVCKDSSRLRVNKVGVTD